MDTLQPPTQTVLEKASNSSVSYTVPDEATFHGDLAQLDPTWKRSSQRFYSTNGSNSSFSPGQTIYIDLPNNVDAYDLSTCALRFEVAATSDVGNPALVAGVGGLLFLRDVNITLGDTTVYFQKFNLAQQFIQRSVHKGIPTADFDGANQYMWGYSNLAVTLTNPREFFIPLGLFWASKNIFPACKLPPNTTQRLELYLENANEILISPGASTVNYTISGVTLYMDTFQVPSSIKSQWKSSRITLPMKRWFRDVKVGQASAEDFLLNVKAKDVDFCIIWPRFQNIVTAIDNLAVPEALDKQRNSSGLANWVGHYIQINGVPYPARQITSYREGFYEFLQIFRWWNSLIGADPEAFTGWTPTAWPATNFFPCVRLSRFSDPTEHSGISTQQSNQSLVFSIRLSAPPSSNVQYDIFSVYTALLTICTDGKVEYTE